jgi:anti-sigma factor RsiW
MKDARFKELLNLHLDNRLSPAEAEELEAALEADPSRRKALRDYEAMQRACAALFARAETRAPSSDPLRRALRQAEDRMAHPGTIRDGWGWPTWGITGGVAACVALVVARLSLPAVGNSAKKDESPVIEAGGAVAVVVASAAVAAPERRSGARGAMPGHLTFAALGLSPGAVNADAASRWILEAEEPAMFATLEEAHAAGELLRAWAPPSAPVQGGAHFSSRPITAWTQSTPAAAAGIQLSPASFRFER